MLYVGLDLSRKRLDFDARRGGGEVFERGAVPPDRDGLSGLVERLGDAEPVLAVIESMSGARFVDDQLELHGWQVRIADAAKARGLAPLACKTDKIDCFVLAELARLDLVPEIWLPDPSVRAERERARFRLHLVKHRSSLKNRVHAQVAGEIEGGDAGTQSVGLRPRRNACVITRGRRPGRPTLPRRLPPRLRVGPAGSASVTRRLHRRRARAA